MSEKLPPDAVIKSTSLSRLSSSLGMYAQVDEIMAQIEKGGAPSGLEDEELDCEVLSPGRSWRKGGLRLKVKIELEFLSDEDEDDTPMMSSEGPGTILDE